MAARPGQAAAASTGREGKQPYSPVSAGAGARSAAGCARVGLCGCPGYKKGGGGGWQPRHFVQTSDNHGTAGSLTDAVFARLRRV